MIRIDPTTCIGCGSCTKVCPHGVLAVEQRIARIDAEERCIECGACQLNCPANALTVQKGTGCLFIIIKEDILKLNSGACSCG